jgi:hypothetical protein
VAQPCVGAGSTIDQRRDGEAPPELSSVESVALRQRAQIVLPFDARWQLQRSPGSTVAVRELYSC